MDDKQRVIRDVFSDDKVTTQQINQVLAQVSFTCLFRQTFSSTPSEKTNNVRNINEMRFCIIKKEC